jgi:hypothetical protein
MKKQRPRGEPVQRPKGESGDIEDDSKESPQFKKFVAEVAKKYGVVLPKKKYRV